MSCVIVAITILVSLLRIQVLVLPMIECFHLYFRKVQR